jgi:riboflavin synthase
MFTGIVEELGEVTRADGGRLTVGCSMVAAGTEIGDSIAVNGVCLTVVEKTGTELAFDLSPETVMRTSLGRAQVGNPVNLERPVSLAARLGGHLVQGHVDGVAEIATVQTDTAGGAVAGFGMPAELMRYVVEKGSISIDGVSLTVARIEGNVVEVALIPHTLGATTLGSISPGDVVNVEIDMIAKYLERLVEGTQR